MRGFHPRPLLSEVLRYREFVDIQMLELISPEKNTDELLELVELGLQHEQQHQELLITDLKFIWGFSPFHPVYADSPEPLKSNPAKLEWLSVEEGMVKTGYSGNDFHFDNESPEHKSWLEGFEIASRPVTVWEYLEFIEA